MKKYLLIIITCLVVIACSTDNTPSDKSKEQPTYTFEIKSLKNSEYPDNPDIGFMAKSYDFEYFDKGALKENAQGNYSFMFTAKNGKDTIYLADVDLMEFIPSIPEHLSNDKYLSQLAVINQEWNRNQVKFTDDQFEAQNAAITVVQIARNCLNSYLWEIIIYTKQNGKTFPMGHGWFDFPTDLYSKLFSKRNGIKFEDFAGHLVNWKDPKSEEVNKNILRNVLDTIELSFVDSSDQMYPLESARLKKYKEIIYPTRFHSMRELQTDKALFATFTPPGFYNKADPRKTQLGRIKQLENAVAFTTTHSFNKDTTVEFVLTFKDDTRTTKLHLGGIYLSDFPTESTPNKGWKSSMGFSNHTFYETYEEHEKWNAKTAPYYAFLSDENNNWLDSHTIGIDGPVFYWDKSDRNKLHLWLLSFERHAFVGHYEFIINR